MASIIAQAMAQAAPDLKNCRFCQGEPDLILICSDCLPDFQSKKLGVCDDCNTIFDVPGNVQCDCYSESPRVIEDIDGI